MDHLIHLPKEGERLDTIAHRYYGDAAKIEPILRANPWLFGRYAIPFRKLAPNDPPLPPTPVLIPIIEEPDTPPAAGLPPWRS